MKSHNPSIIHLVSGKADLQQNELALSINELVLQQLFSMRRASLWQIVISIPSSTETHRRFFREQSKRFSIDPDLEAAILAEGRDTIFHLHGGMNPAFYSVANLLAKNSISFVFSPHNAYEPIVSKRSGYLNTWYFRFYEKKLLQKATAIHCVTKLEAEGLQTVFPNTKTFRVPHGYISNPGRTAIPARDRLVLGFSCDVDSSRAGMETLIHAFSFVKQVNPRAELWIFGESVHEPLLRRKIHSHGVTDDVVFLGARSAEDRAELLSKVNIMIDPACSDVLPAVVIEAASMGVPCVAAACSVIGAAVRDFDCGEVVQNLDETELYNAISTLHYRLGLDGAATFGTRAKEMVAAEFNWKLILPKLDLLYNVA
jgi:glycosyltransferase involved in cell wall biosynthesis